MYGYIKHQISNNIDRNITRDTYKCLHLYSYIVYNVAIKRSEKILYEVLRFPKVKDI